MKLRNVAFALTLIFGFFMLLSMTNGFQNKPKPWVVPEKYTKMKNPAKSDDATKKDGKTMWDKHCKSCHGSKGLGDGSKAAGLKTSAGDFSTAEFQKQVDGDMYYKSFIGRDEMPNFEKKITDEADRWAVVIYMKTMKK